MMATRRVIVADGFYEGKWIKAERIEYRSRRNTPYGYIYTVCYDEAQKKEEKRDWVSTASLVANRCMKKREVGEKIKPTFHFS
jgi:hypothetical protein